MGDIIERLEEWAKLLEGTVGSKENPFVINELLRFGNNILTLLVLVLTVFIILTTLLDITYICFPAYRIALSKAKDKVMAVFGKGENGGGGVRLAHTTRDVASSKADTYGVAHGLLYYLKSRMAFYFFFGMFMSIFFSGDNIMKLINHTGVLVRNMYLTYLSETGGGVPDTIITH